jgi:hypothetical protein
MRATKENKTEKGYLYQSTLGLDMPLWIRNWPILPRELSKHLLLKNSRKWKMIELPKRKLFKKKLRKSRNSLRKLLRKLRLRLKKQLLRVNLLGRKK